MHNLYPLIQKNMADQEVQAAVELVVQVQQVFVINYVEGLVIHPLLVHLKVTLVVMDTHGQVLEQVVVQVVVLEQQVEMEKETLVHQVLFIKVQEEMVEQEQIYQVVIQV